MMLSDVIRHVPSPMLDGDPSTPILAVGADSRQAKHGSLFVAVRGLGFDGHGFIGAACDAGASAVMAQSPRLPDAPSEVAWVQVGNTESALGLTLSAFHGEPSSALDVLAITGTNGKTTVAWLLSVVLEAQGHTVGLIGTVETRTGKERRPTIFTTPPAPILQPLLVEMVEAGCTYCVMEASSHGLAMHRMAGTRVAVGGFTNLTRDHLDFHGDMSAYRQAKASLFTDYAEKACLMVDSDAGRAMADAFGGECLTISIAGGDADITASEVVCGVEGSTAELRTPWGLRTLRTSLSGRYNVENALVALGMATLAGVDPDAALAALGHAETARGRLQRVPGPRAVFVDYAHTPDALANVLTTVRDLTSGRVLCVFGAGGDRDPGKRPAMGRVVAELADLAVVTSDNPRTEAPGAIIAEILAGMPAETERLVVEDRATAIELAIDTADAEDLVLIAGKGHEDYQIVGTERLHFDDVEVAAAALAKLGGAQ